MAQSIGFDVEHYALEIELEPEARTIRAQCGVRMFALQDGLSRIALDFDGLDVRWVRDGDGRDLKFAHADGVLDVDLRSPLAKSDFVELSIAYSGRPVKGLWFSGERDGRVTQVFTQGQCEDSRGWFPCVDRPSERATSELTVTMPASWSAVAAGERLERIEVGGRARELWRMTQAHPAYVTTLVAGEFVVEHGAWDGTPLLFLAEPRYADLMQPNLGRTGEMLEFFSALSGVRYPYAKYSQACVDNLPVSGMENVSATTLIDEALCDERARRDAPSTNLVAHEAAHQWYGDLVTCRDWSHIWLNEGFATYLEALFIEATQGRDEFRLEMRRKQDTYVEKDVGSHRRPLVCDTYDDPSDLFIGGQTYEGGAVRLHLLRFVVGDDAFFRGIKLYTTRHAGSSVVTDDLQRAMEQASGIDLEDFFEQWFEQRGYPEFQVAWKHDARHKLLLITVNQTQDVADGTPQVFRTPVEVEIRDSRGVRSHRLAIDRRRHLFTLPAQEAPLWVRFDKGGWIPKACDDRKATTEWLALAAADDDVNGRRDATRVLGRLLTATPSDEDRARVAAALIERLASDTSYAVRATAAAGLAGDRALEARVALIRAASTDAEAAVRESALKALTLWGKDEELAALARREYETGFSWDTKAACARLLCTAAPEDGVAFVLAELDVESPHGALQCRLIPVFAALADDRVRPKLLTLASDDRVADASRVAAILELGRLGRGSKPVRIAMAGLLTDPSWRVRRAAIQALGALRDEAADAVLREHSRVTAFPTERRAIANALSGASREI